MHSTTRDSITHYTHTPYMETWYNLTEKQSYKLNIQSDLQRLQEKNKIRIHTYGRRVSQLR